MASLSASNLLRVWEEGQNAHPVRRALALLDAASPGSAGWEGVPVGRRDAQLLDLYERLFGSQLESITNCPACDEALETDFNVADIRAPRPELSPGPILLLTAGFNISYRLPTSEDLLQVAASADDLEHAQAALLRRCVIDAQCRGALHAPEELPAAVVERLAEDMAARDPGGDQQIQLSCPRCAHHWRAIFDIVPYLWSALEDWAQRTLADVHLLARAYCWSEQEILGLSATRRRHYVEMVRA